MDDSIIYRWISPSVSGVIHGGRVLEMRTLCGTWIPAGVVGWSATSEAVTCKTCLSVIAAENERPVAVAVDLDGQRYARNADAVALDKIAWILASSDFSVGMLEDIAQIVGAAGHVVEQHDEYIHH